jgi:hypothetical protein
MLLDIENPNNPKVKPPPPPPPPTTVYQGVKNMRVMTGIKNPSFYVDDTPKKVNLK